MTSFPPLPFLLLCQINIFFEHEFEIESLDCTDTSNGATDSNGDTCSYYFIRKEECGLYDDEDFSANDMCCECKG